MSGWPRQASALLVTSAVSVVALPASALDHDLLEPKREVEAAPNAFGTRAGLTATPVASLYYARFGAGLWQPRAETELELTSGFLTGFRGGHLGVERREPLARGGDYSLSALLGTGLAFSNDPAGRYRGWTGLVGVQGTRSIARWELGVRLAYLPTVLTHIDFSDQARDTYRDRYPDARREPGPSSTTLWLPGQRAQALLTSRALLRAWIFDAALGLEWSPLAGRDWTSLELGQLPFALRIGAARRF